MSNPLKIANNFKGTLILEPLPTHQPVGPSVAGYRHLIPPVIGIGLLLFFWNLLSHLKAYIYFLDAF